MDITKKEKTLNNTESVGVTETQWDKYELDKMKLRRNILGEIVKKIALLSMTGMESIEKVLEEEMKKYEIREIKK